MVPFDAQHIDFIRSAAGSDRYAEYLKRILTELVDINTAPGPDPAANAAREQAMLDLIEREIREITDGQAACERPPVDPAIAAEAAYSFPGYAADACGHVLPPETIYAGRTNFLAFVPGGDGSTDPAAILHAHTDVVSPWFPSRVEGGRVYGRGAADDKAQIAILLAQLRLLRELAEHTGRQPRRGFVIQLALDEEIGGNGSVSLARDPRFAGLPVLMLDATDLVPYCAHRGAVYYRCRISASSHPRTTALEIFPYVVMELEAEGRRIEAETNCPLFTQAHVQINQGILGPFGTHSGSVCDHVAFQITAGSPAGAHRLQGLVEEKVHEALEDYFCLYRDKNRETDPATGRPKVLRHFELQSSPETGPGDLRLDVWGKGGHMAAVKECDNAITKAAYLLAGTLQAFSTRCETCVHIRFANSHDGRHRRQVVLEGGLGFTPSHQMPALQQRLAMAARRGVMKYCRLRNLPFEESMIRTTFERLHNDAYADSPESAPMQAFKAAFDALGEPWPEPMAWQTSCDARIYHHHGHPVAIIGAGKLEACHSDAEYVDIPDVQKCLAITTLATWALTG